LKYLSTKSDARLFPPYVPFLGKLFNEYGILVYCTAQNISHGESLVKLYSDNFTRLSSRLEYGDGFKRHYGETDFDISDVDIAPFENGVIPALVAIFIYAQKRIKIPVEHILDYCGVTNYYKFSLHSDTRDLNPDRGISVLGSHDLDEYRSFNNKFVRQELDKIRPKYVISLKGNKLSNLASYSKEYGYTLYSVNDPSWILRGASGKLGPNGDWGKELLSLDKDAQKFISSYTQTPILKSRYEKKSEGVKAYLAHYYNEFRK